MRSSIKFTVWPTLLSVMLVVIVSGCVQRVLDFTIVSSKQMEMSVKDTGKAERTEGEHGIYWFLFIPLGRPNLKEAVDRAIESAGPGYDALIDGVIYSKNYWYILSGYSAFKVEGTPVKTSELKTSFLQDGKDERLGMKDVLFHSSLGISNEEAVQQIGIIREDYRDSKDSTVEGGVKSR